MAKKNNNIDRYIADYIGIYESGNEQDKDRILDNIEEIRDQELKKNQKSRHNMWYE